MKEFDDYSTKEQKQLAICQRLISEKSYLSQEALRRDLQHHGFTGISQSTVSRLLKLLGAIKIRNTNGQKKSPSIEGLGMGDQRKEKRQASVLFQTR